MVSKVFIDDNDPHIAKMFMKRGWEVVDQVEKADMICYGGGSDVSPMLYDEIKHPLTLTNSARDEYDHELFLTSDLPSVGICRGGQFLHIMNGGTMFQNVKNHNTPHVAYDALDGKQLVVSSGHHQMMIPNEDSELIMYSKVGGIREYNQVGDHDDNEYTDVPEAEALFYEETQSLCFQPHPEWVSDSDPLVDYFFLLISQYLELE